VARTSERDCVHAELGLIDEFEFVVHPRLAGHGPTLFAGLSKHVDQAREPALQFHLAMMGNQALTPANDRLKNPRPTLAERPGISCSTEGCGSLVTVGSLANRNDRSVPFRHHVIAIDLAPLISRRRTAKVVLPIVDLIASVPVFLLDLCVRLPFVVLLVSVVVGMILGHGRHACQSHSEDG
jgi:hypothetical protein